MLSEIKSKFMKNPTLYYGMSVAASWAGVGSLMNSITMTTSYGIVPSIIWGLANSIACVIFGIIACRLDTFRDLMRSRAMQCIIGIMSIFQLWLNMNGIHDIFSDTVIGARGGTIIVYVVCAAFIVMLLKLGMIRNVLTDTWSWYIVLTMIVCLTAVSMALTPGGALAIPKSGLDWPDMKVGLYKAMLLIPGPFTFPYFYKILDYNDQNEDGTSRIDVRVSFTLGGILFGAYMVFTYLLAMVLFTPVLNLVKAILVSIVGISTISTFLYSEYIVFGRKLGLAINTIAVAFWPMFISMGVMGIWTLMSEIRIYLVAGMFILTGIKAIMDRGEVAA